MVKDRIFVTDPRHRNSYRRSTSPVPESFLSLNWETAQPKVNYFGGGRLHPKGGTFLPISADPLPPPLPGAIPPQLPPNTGCAERTNMLAYIGNNQTSNGLLGEFLLPVAGGKLSSVPLTYVIPPPPAMPSPQNSTPTTNPQVSDESYTKKRKAISMGKMEESSISPSSNGHKKKKNKPIKKSKSNSKNPTVNSPPKQDFIHVRARRGQATDSHSLAERVRREKISERMKFLQDLVPGCNKVTGKAVMLDEIINYVQSLQQQVEFLSMKLATVNPQLDFNMENLLQKQIRQLRAQLDYPPLNSIIPMSFPLQQSQQSSLQQNANNLHGFVLEENHTSHVNPSESNLRATLKNPIPALLDEFPGSSPQVGNLWEDDLQSVVQMNFFQNLDQNLNYNPPPPSDQKNQRQL